jgi:hypothetical protein
MVNTLLAFNGVAIAGESISGGGDKPVPTTPYGYFPTKDGYVAVAVNVDHLWVKFTNVMDRPELATDERFALHGNRDPRRQEVGEIVSEWTKTLTSDEVAATLFKAGVPCGKVQTPHDLLNDEELRRIGMFRSIDDGMGVGLTYRRTCLGMGSRGVRFLASAVTPNKCFRVSFITVPKTLSDLRAKVVAVLDSRRANESIRPDSLSLLPATTLRKNRMECYLTGPVESEVRS